MIRRCRKHRNLVTKNDWQIIDKDTHTLQLAFTDDLFDHGVTLLLQKWSLIPTMKGYEPVHISHDRPCSIEVVRFYSI